MSDSSARFTILDAVPAGIVVLDRDLRVRFWNEALASTTGVARDEAFGEPIGAFIPSLAASKDTLADVFAAGRSVDLWVRVPSRGAPDAEPGLERAVGSPVPAPEGGRYALITLGPERTSGALRAISSRELRTAEERLFRTVAHKAPVMMWMAGPDASCTFFNPMWLDFTGRSLEQALGHGWAEGVHPDDLHDALVTYFEAFDLRRDFQMEFRLLRHDGAYRWVVNHGTPLYDDGREFAGYICSCLEIHDRKCAEEELRFSKEAAEIATRSKSEFLANMSHEIRTPMTAVLGYAEMLLDEVHGIRDPDDRTEAMLAIRRNGAYLLELLNDILDLSKIEAGRLSLESVRVSPLELVADVQRLMAVRAQSRGLDFALEFGRGVPETIESDPTRIRQILVNLVANAIKFTERGRITLRVEMTHWKAEERLHFVIRDTGIGMSSEQLQRVFEPFTQADSSTTREYGGTGLGLTISTRLTELLGGELAATSAAGEGSVFRVILPTGSLGGVARIDDARAWLDARERETEAASRELDAFPCRVLLAEDGVDNQRLIRAVLAPRVSEVAVAENGQAALEQAWAAEAAGEPFDVILMDMQMPVLDGYEATRRLRRRGYRGAIVALTAHAMEGDRERCLAAGCDEFASKPIDRRALLELLFSLTQKSEAPA